MDSDTQEAWVSFAELLGQTGLDILGGKPVTITEKRFGDPKILAIMIMSRMLSNFRGACFLLRNGLVVEARILTRCCWENAFWLAGLLTHGDTFVRQMQQDDARSRKTGAEMALQHKDALSEDVEKKLRQQMKALNKKWPKLTSTTPKEVAYSTVLRDGYSIYHQLSSDAGHPTLTSLKRHIGIEANGEKLIDVIPKHSDSEVINTWDWLCSAMLGACAAINEILGGTPAGYQLGATADRYDLLKARRP